MICQLHGVNAGPPAHGATTFSTGPQSRSSPHLPMLEPSILCAAFAVEALVCLLPTHGPYPYDIEGMVSVVVSFVDVRSGSARCHLSVRRGRGRDPLPAYVTTQTWKACWGQPLTSSNLVSSAHLSSRGAGGRPRPARRHLPGPVPAANPLTPAVRSGTIGQVIELRALTPEDWAVWRELRLAALEEAPHAFGSRLADWQGDGDRGERWRARLSLPGSYNLVALLDGRPVGMASGVPAGDGDVVELISMWVAPAARGRGVGDLLVRAVERWARQAHAKVVRLCVADGNEAASVLYRRNGFVETGELGDLMADGVRRERVMAKVLSGAAGN
jgi:ribosomal protein S18 acetylase RimI-like enzyme